MIDFFLSLFDLRSDPESKKLARNLPELFENLCLIDPHVSFGVFKRGFRKENIEFFFQNVTQAREAFWTSLAGLLKQTVDKPHKKSFIFSCITMFVTKESQQSTSMSNDIIVQFFSHFELTSETLLQLSKLLENCFKVGDKDKRGFLESLNSYANQLSPFDLNRQTVAQMIKTIDK